MVIDSEFITNFKKAKTIEEKQEYLEVLVKKYHQILILNSYKILGDKDLSLDVVQDTWLYLVSTNFQKFDEKEGKFSSWIQKITKNRALNSLSKQKYLKEKFNSLDDPASYPLNISNKEKNFVEISDDTLLSSLKELSNKEKFLLLKLCGHNPPEQTTKVEINSYLKKISIYDLQKISRMSSQELSDVLSLKDKEISLNAASLRKSRLLRKLKTLLGVKMDKDLR